MGQKTVKEGDCVLSLAADEGLFWQDVWNDSENAGLRSRRQYPNILMPGDKLELREMEEKDENRATEAKHKFTVKGTPARLRLRLRVNGAPVSEKQVKLVVDGTSTVTQTDTDGRLDIAIPPNAKEAEMQVGDDKGFYLLKLGWMTPSDETSGLQARLFNLGYDPKGIDNKFGGGTRKAMQAFQASQNLKRTNEPTDDTRQALEKEHGC